MSKELQKYNPNKNELASIKKAAWDVLSLSSQAAYQNDFDLFFNFIKKSPEEITPNDILAYVKHLESKEYKNATINRKISSISKMFNILKIAGEVKSNPVDVLRTLKNISRKTSRAVKVALTVDDVRKAVKLTRCASMQEHRMSLIIRFLAKTGLRISEFTGIKNKDIIDYDPKNKQVRITGKGKKERFIFIENEFYREIKSIYPDNDKVEFLFYTIRLHRYDRKVLWKQIKNEFWRKAEIKVHPHLLRHFFATHKIHVEKQDIKAVSKFLGHSDVAITLNSYVDTALDVNQAKIKI